MRSLVRAAWAAIGFTFIGGVAHAQAAAPKIAYVNPAALMEAAPGRAAAESLLNKEGAGYRAQLQQLQDSLNAMYAAYQKAEPTLSATAKDQRQKQIQDFENELQSKNNDFQQQFQQRSSEVMAPITETVRRALEEVRSEDGYSMILSNDPQGSPILVADKNLDITDRVVARLRTMAATGAATKPAVKPGSPPAPAGVTLPKKPPTQ